MTIVYEKIMEINENSKKEILENLNTHIETEEKVRDALVSAGLVFTSIGAGILVTTFQVPVLGPIAGTAISTASFLFAPRTSTKNDTRFLCFIKISFAIFSPFSVNVIGE